MVIIVIYEKENMRTKCVFVFVADGINSVGDYNSSPGGCRLYVYVSPLFFTFHDWITSKRFELSC